MENIQVRNFLTSIDTYAFGSDTAYASLNLAESGAREANILARFLHEIVEFHPTYAVFMDGYNEFNSVRYGGEPEDGFYWTGGVKVRVEDPLLFLRYNLYERSRILQILSVSLGFGNPARRVNSKFDRARVERAADYYAKTQAYTELVCAHHRIKCIFILQPISLLERNPSAAMQRNNAEHLALFAGDRDLYTIGYERILSQNRGELHDASQLFDGRENVFLDAVHFNKTGSRLIGEYSRRLITAQ